jgi:5'-3' exoribonuclease 1
MGIPGLFLNYYKKYNCENELMVDFQHLNKINVNHLFFDYNSVLHVCAQQILSINKAKYDNIDINEVLLTEIIESDIIDNCLLYTSYVINQIINNSTQDTKNIYITIDGVAPRSKMNQQRERRYKSEFFKVNNNDEKSSLWDSNKITPGTCFMIKLKHALEKFAKESLNFNCIISDSSENGEGEHKIMQIINNLDINDRIMIYGLDADLIMLSLIHKKCDQIILIRDNSFNNKLSDDKKVIDYLNIKNLKKHIYNDMVNSLYQYKKVNSNELDSTSLIYDYLVICFFLGNDFLDHLPSLSIKKNGIDTIMKAYSYSWKGTYLINKNKINGIHWKSSLNLVYLKDIMYQLKNHESYFFKNFKLENLAPSENIVLTELEQQGNIEFYKDNIIFNTDLTYKKRYYTFYNIDSINNACLNYIEGIYWIFGYYNSHIHKNWIWYYQYHNTPFCSDIFEYLRIHNTNYIQNEIDNSINLIPSHTFSSLKQLYMVLPKNSLQNILSELNNTSNNTNYLFKFNEYYPDKLYVDIINKRYLWQTKIFFNNIDESIIDMFI